MAADAIASPSIQDLLGGVPLSRNIRQVAAHRPAAQGNLADRNGNHGKQPQRKAMRRQSEGRRGD
jgi:hypothetical protein